jgi:hypothetical protein
MARSDIHWVATGQLLGQLNTRWIRKRERQVQYWAILLFLLAGCSPETRPYEVSLEQEQRDKRPPTPVPIEPDRLRASDVMASPDAFIVYPNTNFCELIFTDPELRQIIARQSGGYQPPGPGVGLTGFFDNYPLPLRTMDSPSRERRYGYNDGRPNSMALTSLISNCPNNNINLIFTHHVTLTNDRSPYRIIVTLRQGNRLYVRSVERAWVSQSVLIGQNHLTNELRKDGSQLGQEMIADLLGERP